EAQQVGDLELEGSAGVRADGLNLVAAVGKHPAHRVKRKKRRWVLSSIPPSSQYSHLSNSILNTTVICRMLGMLAISTPSLPSHPRSLFNACQGSTICSRTSAHTIQSKYPAGKVESGISSR